MTTVPMNFYADNGADEFFIISGGERAWVSAGNNTSDRVQGRLNGLVDLVVYGGTLRDIIELGSGADTIYGDDPSGIGGSQGDPDSGNFDRDWITGGGNMDKIFGQGGNDNISGDNGDDWISGGVGDDTLQGGQANDIVYGDAGNDLIFGGTHPNQVEIQQLTIEVTHDGKTNAFLNPGGVPSSFSGKLPDESIVDTGDDRLFGGDGNDTINGQDGNDRLNGDEGDDILSGAEGEDILVGGEGNDTLDGGAGIDTLRGGAGDDTYLVEDMTDVVSDGGGTDTIVASSSYILASGKQIENLKLNLATALGFSLTGNQLDQTLTGNNVANLLTAGAGADRLFGLGGGDILVGGLGRDTMAGGLGNDLFRFGTRGESGVGATADRIVDFDDFGNDRIDVSKLFGPRMDFISRDAFDGAGQVRINDVAGADVVVEVNTGGSLAADFSVRLLATTAASMTASDFIL